MIATLLRIGWINLRRDRVVQALSFVLPILFFSIFALVFGNQRSSTRKVQIALVDEDRSAYSEKVAAALAAEGGLNVRTSKASGGEGDRLDRAGAEALVRAGTLPVAVILPKGLGESRRFWTGAASAGPKVALLADVSDPIAPQMVLGLLQKVGFTAAPESLATEGMAMFEKFGGPLTPAQEASKAQWLADLQTPATPGATTPASAGAAAFGLQTEVINVLHPDQGDTATVSFYAAGIGVMFLLFSCSGAGGALLDEEESGTLGRLVGSRVGMSGVLFGKWLFLTLSGIAQLTVMFTWGHFVFALPMAGHITGFIIMTTFTAAAAAGFGLLLASIARTRQQLSGISTILILTMSAVGGSMFPRFLMTDTMQKFGLVTFNAWALDGYLKVFWRSEPLINLWPQLLVLTMLTVVFLALARRGARRWETV